jgi:hypothetical protein
MVVLLCIVLQVWCVVLLCFILGLPMLHSYVAFAAITSIGVIGLYISYLGMHCCRELLAEACDAGSCSIPTASVAAHDSSFTAEWW